MVTTMLAAVLAAVALILGLVAGVGVAAVRRFGGPVAAPEPSRPRATLEQVAEIAAELQRLKIEVAGLPSLWASERERMEDASERAKAHRASARAQLSQARRLAEDSDDESEDGDDDESEAPELRLNDARREQAAGVLPMRESLAQPTERDVYERGLRALGLR